MIIRQFTPPALDITPEQHQQAIQEAFTTLHAAESTPDQAASARCYLTYRHIDGLLTWQEYQHDVLDVPVKPLAVPLASRWQASQLMADTYLHILTPSPLVADYFSTERANIMFAAARGWPPAILNALRYYTLMVYHDWLATTDIPRSKADYEYYVGRPHREWTQTLGFIKVDKFPYRYTESLDDCRTMQFLMFIARKAGILDFPDQPWCQADKIIGTNYFSQSLRKLGESNPEAAILK